MQSLCHLKFETLLFDIKHKRCWMLHYPARIFQIHRNIQMDINLYKWSESMLVCLSELSLKLSGVLYHNNCTRPTYYSRYYTRLNSPFLTRRINVFIRFSLYPYVFNPPPIQLETTLQIKQCVSSPMAVLADPGKA